jgi:uncharacterized membrane protein YagU involved in acid resistance
MSSLGWLFWGFAATVVLTTIMSGAQGLGLTRMSIPYLLGSMFTASRDRAKLLGVIIHMANGWAFSLVYLGVFQAWGRATWWAGAAIGVVHAAFLLTAGMEVLPALHPRMASEQRGPTIVRQLEPPGFFAMHYGVQTPVTVLVAHVVYGMILGAFYTVR